MSRTLMSLVAAASLLIAAAPSAAAQADPSSVLQQLIAAFNRNDEAAILNLFTDDAVILGGPCGGAAPGNLCVGKPMLGEETRGGGPVQVQLTGTPRVSGEAGTVVPPRVENRFDPPPQAVSAGVNRQVEVG